MSKPSPLPPSFYDHLVSWEKIDSLLDHFEEDHRHQALLTIFESLDHEVLGVVLTELDNTHHPDFLHMCSHSYHQASLLEWLESKNPGITLIIQEVLVVTKDRLTELLLE